MLTRLFVDGFKNLVDTEVFFGPFSCIAGSNGVGKSNVFDAIYFLSRLADQPFVEAARATRGGADIVELFTAGGDSRMRFELDMLIPPEGKDDFHQPAKASQTFLTYKLTLQLQDDLDGLPRVRLLHESLEHIPRSSAKERLGFEHSKTWRESAVRTSQRRAAFIVSADVGDDKFVRLNSDKMRDESKLKRGGGRPTDFLARTLPRTVLSAAQYADEARTAVLARAEMRSWRILQLEPSALRRPDELQAPSVLGAEGEHLPATLYRLASTSEPERVYAEVSNRLAELVNDVRFIRVDRDNARRVLRLIMTDQNGVELPGSSLSDGTLRFIALSVIEQDPRATGLICLEEPENGIHPERMDAMVGLLSDMAVDTTEPVGEDNPLRQIIVSTHSPVVAARVSPEDLLFADHRDPPNRKPGCFRALVIRPVTKTRKNLSGTSPVSPVAKGDAIRYLGAIRPSVNQEAPDPKLPRTMFAYVTEQLDLPFGGSE